MTAILNIVSMHLKGGSLLMMELDTERRVGKDKSDELPIRSADEGHCLGTIPFISWMPRERHAKQTGTLAYIMR